MFNYWLDRKLSRNANDETWLCLKRMSGKHHNASGKDFPLTQKIEFRHNGKVFLPETRARFNVSDKAVSVSIPNSGNIPLKTYIWLADVFEWGTVSDLSIEVFFSAFVGQNAVFGVTKTLTLEDVTFVNCSDAVRIDFNFSRI